MFSGVVTPILFLAFIPFFLGRARRAVAWGTAGIYLLLLGVAGPATEWDALATPPASYLAVSAGLAWLGFALLAGAAWDGWRADGMPTSVSRSVQSGPTVAPLRMRVAPCS